MDTFFSRFTFTLISIFCVCIPSIVFAQTVSDCSILSRNLKLGMSGNDVLVLQRLLNTHVMTRLAPAGAGSPGFETTYFGEKTRAAVVRFQELYSGEVLSPVGLTSGNGFVGAYSRAKLTALCKQETATLTTPVVPQPLSGTGTVLTAPTPPPTLATGTASLSIPGTDQFLVVDEHYFYVRAPSLYVVHPSDKVTIYGGGFTAENNTLRIGTLSFMGLQPTSLGTLEVTIPADAPYGKFDLWVENSRGASNKSFIIITRLGTAAPVIDSVAPTVTQIGKTIIVAGSGFTGSNNEIYLSVNTIKGIASPDGKTLSFVFAVDIPGVTPELIPQGTTRNISVPVSFYVVNANGISNRATFTVAY